ncbi:UvrD-helicase domain-containing protein [Brevibacterium luteolum]|uniref:UvrD-helicase domain-containing protein n=1 Tax=Brevibacterium luteolum TaxID=199591 RepID=UPI003B677F18
MTDKQLVLAVAGSGKTQRLVDLCVEADLSERILILTYTAANQDELRRRLANEAGEHHRIEVSGWFSFLIANFVRPYLPFVFPDRKLEGFDFHSPPQQYSKNDSWSRYFNHYSQARRAHLAQLAHWVNEAAAGAPIRRLALVYDRILIDEAQDLCGWDLEILELLLKSPTPLYMVGDVRQAILATNPREKKNKKFMYMGIWQWFRQKEAKRKLQIRQERTTHRYRAEIASFADSLFDTSHGFEPTETLNNRTTAHDGIYLVRSEHVAAYIRSYRPLFLRNSVNSGKQFSKFAPMNIGASKGLEREHVLVYPTGGVQQLLQIGTPLTPSASASLYVAATRAKQSLAFILDKPGDCVYKHWSP